MEKAPWTTVPVRCYAGRRYAERPIAFVWQGSDLPVEEVLSEWREPAGPAFRVRTARGVFCLRYLEREDRWLARAEATTPDVPGPA